MTINEPIHVKGPTLSHVLASGSTWERAIVPIEPGARIALATVTGLLVLAVVGVRYLIPSLLTSESPGLFLFGWPWAQQLALRTLAMEPLYILLVLLLLLFGALTSGFAHAGRRLQIGLGSAAALGAVALLLPLAVLLLALANLVAWIALGVLGAALAIGLFVALLSGIDS